MSVPLSKYQLFPDPSGLADNVLTSPYKPSIFNFIFSLGVIAYEIVVGAAPFPGLKGLDVIRALAEAEERRRKAGEFTLPKELGGRDGPEPVRYGDWEKKGLAVDF